MAASDYDPGRRQLYKDPLPAQIWKMREETFSIFISNLPQQISKAETEAIFWRAGRLIDVFIPKDKRNNSTRGFAFVRFATLREAEKAVGIAEGRFWGERKIQANLAKFSANSRARKEKERSKWGWNAFMQSSFQSGDPSTEVVSDQARSQGAEGKNDGLCSIAAGSLVEENTGNSVRVAPWVVKEQKKSLYKSLVGFLKSESVGLEQIEQWLLTSCGQMPLNIQKLDKQVIWLQFSSSGEVEEVLFEIASRGCSSPFSLIKRWMEVLGSPPIPTWVKVKGMPLQAWHEGVFRLIGDCG